MTELTFLEVNELSSILRKPFLDGEAIIYINKLLNDRFEKGLNTKIVSI